MIYLHYVPQNEIQEKLKKAKAKGMKSVPVCNAIQGVDHTFHFLILGYENGIVFKCPQNHQPRNRKDM